MHALLKTQLRRKLLSYTFTHDDSSYYVRELAGLIEADPGNLSRELNKLKDEGIYTCVTRGKEKFYSLNKAHPLFSELKSIVFKTVGVEGILRDAVVRHKGIGKAFLYGSYAQAKEKASSDIDLVLVGDFDRDLFTKDVRDIEKRLDREINFTSYTTKEFNKESKNKGSFLNMVVHGKIILLKGGL